jgi:hypothetical protein
MCWTLQIIGRVGLSKPLAYDTTTNNRLRDRELRGTGTCVTDNFQPKYRVVQSINEATKSAILVPGMATVEQWR